MVIFINGKQNRVPRPPTMDGMSVHEFIEHNAGPIWLHQTYTYKYPFESALLDAKSEPTMRWATSLVDASFTER